MMITYYDRGGIRVTSNELVVHTRHYLLNELDDLVFHSGFASGPTYGCAATAAVFAVLAGWSSSLTGNSATSAFAIVIAIVGLIATMISHRLNPPAHELWAKYHNEVVRLHWSRNAHEFNRIRVALWHARQARS